MRGRIIRGIAGFYYVAPDPSEADGTLRMADRGPVNGLYECRAKGIFRKDGKKPLPGDYVEFDITSEEEKEGNVSRILPRSSALIRPAVANVDALVVFAANVNPVTEPFLIDRVAAVAGSRKVPVILCLNKTDLDPAAELGRIYEQAGFPVIRTSAKTGAGMDRLRDAISGKLTAFTGNSGVGKSSVLNCLARALCLQTGAVS